jgi:hypothetical protein
MVQRGKAIGNGAAVGAELVSGAASAAFIDQGGGVILDTITNLEWEQNANHGPFDWAERSPMEYPRPGRRRVAFGLDRGVGWPV